MKEKLFFALVASFIIHFGVSAQKKQIHFHSINTFELISGQSETKIGYQTINGIRFSNWFSGIGIGVDNYHYRTLPLFFDGRWYFTDKQKAFAFGDLGYNFPMNDKPGKEIPYNGSYHFTGGIYTDLGIGFHVPLYKKNSLLFSLGYSTKKLKTKARSVIRCRLASCPVDFNVYDFNFNRMILKAGLAF